MSEKYYTKEAGWTEAGIAEQERRSELAKLTADELRVRFDVLRPKMNVPARLVLAEISRRLERLEQLQDENRKMNTTIANDALEIWDLQKRLEKCEAAIKDIYQIATKALAEPMNESGGHFVEICNVVEDIDAARAPVEVTK